MTDPRAARSRSSFCERSSAGTSFTRAITSSRCQPGPPPANRCGHWSAAGYLRASTGPLPAFHSLAASRLVPWVDVIVPVALALVGVSLTLGLFTRLGCWVAMALLALFYVAAIPTSGAPVTGQEGTYLLVSKNLIELVAVLVVLTSAPSASPVWICCLPGARPRSIQPRPPRSHHPYVARGFSPASRGDLKVRPTYGGVTEGPPVHMDNSPSISRRSFVQLVSAIAGAPLLARAAMTKDAAASATSSLWYRRPAQRWVEALPVGNGRLGAMVFGGVGDERLQLNDDTLWSGGPRHWNNPKARGGAARGAARCRWRATSSRPTRLAKQADGPVHAVLPAAGRSLAHRSSTATSDATTAATLDLRDAVATVAIPGRRRRLHARGDRQPSRPGHRHPARRRSARPPHVRRAPAQPAAPRRPCADGDICVLRGRAPAHVDPSYYDQDDPVRLRTTTRRHALRAARRRDRARRPAARRTDATALHVENADAVTLLLAAATSFNGFDKSPVRDGRDARAVVAQHLAGARARRVGRPARRARRRPSRAVRSRVTLRPAGATTGRRPTLPTDERIADAGRDGPAARRAALPVRPLPADRQQPSRHAAGEPAGHLERRAARAVELELHDQHQHRDELLAGGAGQPRRAARAAAGVHRASSRSPARKTAATSTTARAAGRRTTTRDLWRHSAPVGNFGDGDPVWALWPMAGAWLSQHLCEHYAVRRRPGLPARHAPIR